MKVKIIKEEGVTIALLGLGLSYGITSNVSSIEDLSNEEFSKLIKVANKLAYSDNGENKFLRQIKVWLDIEAPLYWWKQFDTYKVGTTAQSESTMHTIMNSKLTLDNFEYDNYKDNPSINLADNLKNIIKMINEYIDMYKAVDSENRKERSTYFNCVISMLPNSFKQRRIVSLNYAALQNIIKQRKHHKLDEWYYFCVTIFNNVKHKEWLFKVIG